MKPEIGAALDTRGEDESNTGPQSRSARPCRKARANDESKPGTGLKVVLTHIGMYKALPVPGIEDQGNS